MTSLDIIKKPFPNGDILVRDYYNHTWQGLMLTKEAQKELRDYFLNEWEE